MILAATALALAACGDNAFAPVEPQIASIQVAADAPRDGMTPLLSVGEGIRLTAVDQQGRTLPDVEWTTNDIRRAGISEDGKVFAHGIGDVLISARRGAKIASQSLRIQESKNGNGRVKVASVTISPSSVTLEAGNTAQLKATVTASDGSILTDRSVTWTTSNTAVATVSSTGLVKAIARGTVQIAASADRKTGYADVSVTAAATAPAPVASVTISPTSATLAVGASQTFKATLYDANGQVLTGRTVTWTTSNASVASVSADGVANALAAGTATITATSETKSASASVTVEATTEVPPSLVTECAAPETGWIWCDDFEQDRMSSYFEHNDHNGDFVRTAAVGVEGSSAMRARWQQAGQVGAGWMHVAFGRTPNTYMDPVDAGTKNYREIYWRVYLKYAPGWVGGGGNKITRAKVFAKSDWTEAMQALVWSSKTDPEYLVIDPVSYTDASGTLTGTARWLGSRKSSSPIFTAENVGRWRCIETRVRMNDAGQSNGVFSVWVDGTQTLSRSDLNWVGSYNDYGLNTVSLENYWNDGAPQAQERYFDNLVVSTQRIGC